MHDSAHVMWSIGEIAKRDGISKQAVAKKVAKLIEQHDLPVRRDGRGRVALVSVAHFDHHLGLFANSAKTPVRPDGKPTLDNESRDEALRQSAWLDLDRARLKHLKEAGELLRADRQRDAMMVAGRTIQSEVNRLSNRADDLATAVAKSGSHGARLLLRQISVEINTKIADALTHIAAEAPALDPPIEEAAP